MNNYGFTLIEIVLVTAIIVVLFTMGAVSYGRFLNINNLKTERNKIIEHLRLAQERAKAGFHDQDYGIHFGGTRYTLYSGGDFDSRDSDKDKQFKLEDSVKAPSSTDVNFEIKTGLPASSSTITLSSTNKNITSSIKVNKEGLIYHE